MSVPRLCPTCRLQVGDNDLRCPRDGTPLMLGRSELRDPLLGTQLGEFRIEQRIGSGGMGFVYRAVQPLIGKQVAVKILRPEIAGDPEQMQRLLAEARAVTAIHHRGIIDIFGFGQLPDGRQYMVMELLEGVTLEHVIESGRRLPLADAIAVLDEILSALAAAHAAGVIHRDLKPSNLFLAAQSDGTSVVKVLDFGLAKRTAPGQSTPQTRISLMVGTPEYMAPEQARGEPVGTATDLYSMGVIAYQLLAGRLPFEGATPIEIVLQHMDKAPPPLLEVAPELPAGLQALILSLLAKAPSARPQRAEELRHKLRQLNLPGVTLPPMALSGATALRPPVLASSAASTAGALPSDSPSSGLEKTAVRRRPMGTATAVIAASLVAVAGAVVALTRPPAKAPAVSPSPAPRPPAPQAAVPPALPGKPSTVAAAVAGSAGGERGPVSAEAGGAPAGVAATPSQVVPAQPVKSAPAARREPEAAPHRKLAAPSTAALRNRIDRLEARLNALATPGSEPDPLAMALLKKARADAADALEPIQRARIGHRLDVIESKFLAR